MAVTRWADIKDKVSADRRAEIKREAVAELDRIGFAALRKARELTQVELAEKLGITQASVAGLEARTDLQLSTLAKYIRALGGELEIRAVFPEATFHLDSPVPTGEQHASKAPTKMRTIKKARSSRSNAA